MNMTDEKTTLNEDEGIYRSGGGELHPHGVYRAQFKEFEVVDSEYKGLRSKRVRLGFITDADTEGDEPAHMSAFSSPSFNTKAKIIGFLRAVGVTDEQILGFRKNPSTFSLRPYLDKKLMVVVEHYDKEDGTTGAKIVSFQPIPSKKKTVKPDFDDE